MYRNANVICKLYMYSVGAEAVEGSHNILIIYNEH